MKILTAPQRSDRPLPASVIVGHHRVIGVQRRDVWGWWILGPAQWAFTPVDSQEDLLSRAAAGLAGLAGHRVHLRRTEIPISAAGWAAHLDGSTPDPLPDVDGCPETWAAHLDRGQDALTGSMLRVVAVGVHLGQVPSRWRPGRDLPPDIVAVDRQVSERFGDIVFAARPAQAREVAWLVHRSVGVGCPSPTLPGFDWWDEDQTRAFGGLVSWESSPTGRAVKVTAERDGRIVERWVSVLTMGRIEDRRFPEDGRVPWLAHVDGVLDPVSGLPVEVEVSASGRVVSGRDATEKASRWLMRGRNIRKHYGEHGEEPPPTVDRVIAHATDVYDEVTEGPTDVAARWHGVIRFAVHADSEDEACRLGRVVRDTYEKDQKMWVEHPGGPGEPGVQAELLAEFNPGATPARSGYQRHMPVRVFAAGVSNMGDTVGTPSGPLLGWTTGVARRPVFHDGHYPMRHNRPGDTNNNSGFVGVIANLGAGKSLLLGTIAEERARAGIPTWVLDPSPGAPLAKLCDLPYLAPWSQHIALSGAAPGLLNPYRLVLDPPRRDGWDDARYRAELAGAAGDRKELVVDTIMSLLPDSTRRRDGMEDAVRAAVAEAGGRFGTSPWRVIDALAEAEPMVARSLGEMAEGIARLVFPDRTQGPELVKAPDRGTVLTVITTGDLVLPDPDSDRDDWSPRERAASTALGLAAFLTTRGVYAGDMGAPKTVILDEIRVLREWRSGRTMVKKLGFDARKYTAEILAACQDEEHLSSLGVAPVLGGCLLGRHLDGPAARRALATGGVHAPPSALTGLGIGEWVYRDTFGRVATVQVKAPHPMLDAALDTTPADVVVADRGAA